MRVTAIGKYHTAGDVYATGINVETLGYGAITLSNAGNIFQGQYTQAIHVGVDASKTLTAISESGSLSAVVTSVPFYYAKGSGKARAVVSVSVDPRAVAPATGGGSGGFKILDEADGTVLLESGPLPFEPNSGDVKITQ